jgi:hypothetical protein
VFLIVTVIGEVYIVLIAACDRRPATAARQTGRWPEQRR